ncbi:MAG: hypothetical protein ACJAWG_001065, partial [Candidatus Azotimanducaceae bacterium]
MAATKSAMGLSTRPTRQAFIALLAVFLGCQWCHAAVLPEDRLDLLYHVYDGDNATIQGPSILVRKAVNENISVHAN